MTLNSCKILSQWCSLAVKVFGTQHNSNFILFKHFDKINSVLICCHVIIVLEVYQFARDSDAAEAWLLAQDAYLGNQDLGENLDAVENLIKRHETFEKAAFAQEDRFLALERLTTVRLYCRTNTYPHIYIPKHFKPTCL